MSDRGFSLLEAIVATAIVTSGLMALAQLTILATRANAASRAAATATMLAVDKMEQLRACAWTVDVAGLPVSDAALQSSPSGTLDADVDGFFDRVPGWTRRWSVTPLPSNAETLVLQVRVVGRRGEESRLTTARTRRAN